MIWSNPIYFVSNLNNWQFSFNLMTLLCLWDYPRWIFGRMQLGNCLMLVCRNCSIGIVSGRTVHLPRAYPCIIRRIGEWLWGFDMWFFVAALTSWKNFLGSVCWDSLTWSMRDVKSDCRSWWVGLSFVGGHVFQARFLPNIGIGSFFRSRNDLEDWGTLCSLTYIRSEILLIVVDV